MKRALRRRFVAGALVGALVGLFLGFNAGFFTIGYLANRLSKMPISDGAGRTSAPLAKPTLSKNLSPPSDLNFGLRLEDETGRPVSLGAFRGKVVFLNVWATWCQPCIAEMPALAALYKQVGSNPRLAFLSVAKDDSPTLHRFLAKEKLPFPVHRLPEGSEIEGTGTAVPVTLIAGRDGRILTRIVGAADWSDPSFVAELRMLVEK